MRVVWAVDVLAYSAKKGLPPGHYAAAAHRDAASIVSSRPERTAVRIVPCHADEKPTEKLPQNTPITQMGAVISRTAEAPVRAMNCGRESVWSGFWTEGDPRNSTALFMHSVARHGWTGRLHRSRIAVPRRNRQVGLTVKRAHPDHSPVFFGATTRCDVLPGHPATKAV